MRGAVSSKIVASSRPWLSAGTGTGKRMKKQFHTTRSLCTDKLRAGENEFGAPSHDLPVSVSVEVINNGSSARCPRCASVFVLASEGQPATGSVSRYYLKKYRTTFNPNTGDLQVYN